MQTPEPVHDNTAPQRRQSGRRKMQPPLIEPSEFTEDGFSLNEADALHADLLNHLRDVVACLKEADVFRERHLEKGRDSWAKVRELALKHLPKMRRALEDFERQAEPDLLAAAQVLTCNCCSR